MRKRISLFHPVMVFILAQLAWLSLLGLWIYWYVSNYFILTQVAENLSPKLLTLNVNILALVSGCILLVALLAGMYFIFIFLTKQVNITRMYDNFIANVTHELKSPLASLQLYLETMKLRKVTPERQQEFINLMIHDSSRLKNLIDSILQISAIEQRKTIYNFQDYPVGPLVKELAAESGNLFRLKPGNIKITGTADCIIRTDRNALKSVFNNLIENALKYTPGELQLRIHIACDARKLILEFSDSGIGIEKKEQKKIFHKFYRIYRQDNPNIKGTGIGLFMTREIIKLHRGKISVFSAGSRKGTTFRIELPAKPRDQNKGMIISEHPVDYNHSGQQNEYEKSNT